MKIFLLIWSIALFSLRVGCQISSILNFSSMPGMQIYFIYSNTSFYYTTLEGNSTYIEASLNLYVTNSVSNISQGSGIYAGIGFGNNKMSGSDIVICSFQPMSNFTCSDAMAIGYSIAFDNENGGVNNVITGDSRISSLNSSFLPYKTLLSWRFVKEISSDSKDWADASSWNIRKASVIGSYGYLSATTLRPTRHVERSGTNLTLYDGCGKPEYIIPYFNQTINNSTKKGIIINDEDSSLFVYFSGISSLIIFIIGFIL